MSDALHRWGRVVLGYLPRGRTLSEDVWRVRHRTLLWLLRLHVAGIAVFALVRGRDVVHALGFGALIAAFAILADRGSNDRRFASAMTSLGLVTSSAVLVYLGGGLIELHFHFFVVVGILTLYQDWLPFLLAVVFVLLDHAIVGYIDPKAVYDHANAIHDPIGWAVVHAVFLLAACVASVVAWKMNEDGALRDPLTRLPNRALFQDRLEHALARSERRPARIAVLFIDLDGFKGVNDSLGHAAGDQLLRGVADRLRPCLRRADTPARLGGDEFAVILEDTPVPQVLDIAHRILDALAAPLPVGSGHASITASIGIAVSEPDDTVDSIVRKADVAMYAVKAGGRGRAELFAPAMHMAAVERLEYQRQLRDAVSLDQMVLHYQPLIALDTGLCFGAEALVRWAHPTRGLLSPAMFISTAESTGAIAEIGAFVIGEACRQAREWQLTLGRDDIRVSVNVSPVQLRGDELVDCVRAALERTGLPPATLILELTETVLVGQDEHTARQLTALRELGVELAVDDFGTGYSALSYLRRLPVSIVKIDKSFIDRINDDLTELALVEGIVRLANTLGLATVAEGVERAEQVDALRQLGCDMVQGFVYARPVPAAEALALIDCGGRTQPWSLTPAIG